MTLDVTVQYFDGCPSWKVAVGRVQDAATRAGVEILLRLERVETLEEATRLGFVGSPTVLVEGHDVCAPTSSTPALTCRLYRTDGGLAGSPSVADLEHALSMAASGHQG